MNNKITKDATHSLDDTLDEITRNIREDDYTKYNVDDLYEMFEISCMDVQGWTSSQDGSYEMACYMSGYDLVLDELKRRYKNNELPPYIIQKLNRYL